MSPPSQSTASDSRLESLPRTRQAIQEGIAGGLHLGAQLYVSRHGEPAADAALGESRPGRPLAPRDLMLWLSSTKPVTAVALAQLWERGLLDLDDPVARHLPEFAAHGKQAITLRHLLTHTGGIRLLDVGWPAQPWEAIVARIAAMKPEPRWVPGRKAGYHTASSWFVLGEVVRRLDGRPFSRYVREAIFEPLGMLDSWIGMPRERYLAYRLEERLAPMWDTESGRPVAKDHSEPPAGERQNNSEPPAGERQNNGEPPAGARQNNSEPPSGEREDSEPPAGARQYTTHPWDGEPWVTGAHPGGNGYGPLRELGRFYEMLLARGRGPGGGACLLSPQAVEALTARHRTGMLDHTFQHVLDWGLGFILESSRYGADTVPYGYGHHASPRTFGHSGYRSSTAFADPEAGLVVALAFNGTPANAAHERRVRAVTDAIYEDLGLAG
jgi:CubicO group peptidase (beta-lactamase class C family)